MGINPSRVSPDCNPHSAQSKNPVYLKYKDKDAMEFLASLLESIASESQILDMYYNAVAVVGLITITLGWSIAIVRFGTI
jgi:hypothetical protein